MAQTLADLGREPLRKAQHEAWREALKQRGSQGPSHPGLAYTRWGSGKPEGKEEGQWKEWWEWLERAGEPQGYSQAYERWKRSLQPPHSVWAVVRAESRLLVGHGLPSATEVGLTLHHTWGVPMVPGSALKGLTAAWVEAVYGPDSEQERRESPARAAWAGPQWDDNGKRVVRGPEQAWRWMFGSPEVVGPEPVRAAASQGLIVFHDALWVPPQGDAPRQPLARDVLTVHQRAYYGQRPGKGEKPGEQWPTDHDEPNPVAFLTVKPGVKLLVALSVAPGAGPGGQQLLQRARQFLLEALGEWGVGGKGSAGYGRLVVEEGTPRR